MKRDDIIGQKLFETSKLSEFYLNLIVSSTLEEESPLQLANAFTHKLNEIVHRYDRLLEANKQKEHFSLSFDHSKSANQTIKHKPPTPTIPLGRCSTPNKNLNLLSNNSTASTPSDASSTPNYLNSFFRKSHSNLSLNKHWNSSTSNLNLSRKQSHKHYYTRQLIYNTKSPNGCAPLANSENTSVKYTKLCQRIASIYYGSESEEEEINAANDTSDEIDVKYDFSYKHDFLKYINDDSQATKSKNNQSGVDNDLLITSTISSSESSSSNASAASNNYECSISDNNSTMSAHIADVTQTPTQIGKSYSNLSKDSGVFMGESYHSEYSSAKTPQKLVKHKAHEESGIENDGDNEDDGDEEEEEDEDLNETGDNHLEEYEEESKNEFKKNAQHLTNQFVWGAINPASSIDEKEREEEKDEPQVLKPIPSLKEHFLQNHKNHVDSRTYRKMLPSGLRSRQNFMQSEYTSKIKYINHLNQYKPFSQHQQQPLSSSSEDMISAHQKNSSTDEFNGIETGLMSMIIDAKNDGHYNMSDVGNTSLNYDESSTTASSSSSHPLEQNYSASVNDLTNTTNNNKQQPHESGLFFNNSLMNVSMLDNIQATNTNLDYMSSSILMFN